ncbi:MAG: FkbM family methyltransferase [Tabrizicola sp.]|uniref:FkbM family methyltransferase n=1 Tax=Tabrizicola sp. TaxID=2005166 RepID=UPI002732A83E|nr:FkbM family methyltransferase [Tabrizicola sp.]MDP3264353.1 FkbM family methyltransferase [Tabrizicola sp.]MDP3648837.1 FkbM family methyltransferase [Paracoccaceae bacterium]MDZ4065738.1 FkbM family methyltransferase [Tabrizicola sp.]
MPNGPADPPPSPSIADCLDPEAQSRVGVIPGTAPGAPGHAQALDIFFGLLADLRPAVFCDIGANKGEAGRRALATLPDLVVFGFEANPVTHARHAAINTAAGVRWTNAAVSDRPGTVTLHVPRVLSRALQGDRLAPRRLVERADTGKASLLQRDEDARYDHVEVASVRLDDHLAAHAPAGRVALWIDVEGAASLVLAGATETLARTDLMIIEVEGFGFWKDQVRAADLLDLLGKVGFTPVLRDREYGDAQFNVICVRASASQGETQRHVGARLDALRPTPPAMAASGPLPTPATTPVLIPCFNNPSYAANMLRQLRALGFADITFVDNASDSADMHAFLDSAEQSGATVERLSENLGPRHSIFTPERLQSLPRWFCLTDPDLEFNPALPEDFLATLASVILPSSYAKAGFALNIANRDALRQDKIEIEAQHHHIWEWEQQFWIRRLGFTPGGDPVYKAPIDTTFALYDKLRVDNFFRSLRVGGRMTAEHLPWYPNPPMTDPEASHYRASQKFSFYHR